MLENRVANELGLAGPKADITLRWTSDICRVEPNSRRVTFQVSGSGQSSHRYSMENVRTVSSLNLPQQSLTQTFVNAHDHLSQLPIQPYTDAKPTLLIGLDHYNLVVPQKIRENKWEEPIAVKTRLGWMVCGSRCNANSSNVEFNFHICECHRETDESLHDLVKQHYTLDNFGVAATEIAIMSKDDERAMELLKTTTSRIGYRYQTGLLWKYDEVEFPDSRPMALRRLECLERKMARDEPLATEIK